jgi:hypothetical protein
MWRFVVTTRASRTVSRRPFFPSRVLALPGLFLALSGLLAYPAAGQEPESEAAQPESTQQPSANDIVVAPHWSRNQWPTSYPEGTQLHIVQRGDTLWDISNTYLRNPFLWPQLWDANRYIENPHLIYPGDPVRIPDLDVVRGEGEEPGAAGPGGPGAGPGEEGGPGAGGPGAAGQPGGPEGPQFRPAYEEITIQCAGYLREEADDDFRIFGSEEDGHKDSLSKGDVVYLNRGSEDGVSPGDTFYTQREVDFASGAGGSYIRRTGWLRILAVQEETAMAEIVQACLDVHLGDYLLPFEPIPVPLLPLEPPPTRLTPETGRMRGRIEASLDDLATLGQGYLVSIDLGQEDGVVPGNVFTIFRYLYDGAREGPGNARGPDRSARAPTADHGSRDYILAGDLVELK